MPLQVELHIVPRHTRVIRLTRILEDRSSDAPEFVPKKDAGEMNESERETLRALGYVDS